MKRDWGRARGFEREARHKAKHGKRAEKQLRQRLKSAFKSGRTDEQIARKFDLPLVAVADWREFFEERVA